MKDDKKEEDVITLPMLSREDIMDAHPEHYGKYVVIKSFNDKEIVAYGLTPEAATKEAESKGYKTVGHIDDPVLTSVMTYCFAACEEQRRYKMVVDMEMVNGDCERCPVCKYRNSPIGETVKDE